MLSKVIVVTGGRDLSRKAWRPIIEKALAEYQNTNTLVIHGNAFGADMLARDIALDLGMTVIPFPADWEEYGKAAGPIRNRAMIDTVLPMFEYGNDVEVFAFHPDVMSSKGTLNMVRASWDAYLPIRLYQQNGKFTVYRRVGNDTRNPFRFRK